MKGGGIVVLVIFIFLFFCFIWGIASVVGSAHEKLQAKSKKTFWPPKSEKSSYSKPMPGDFQTKDDFKIPMADEKNYAPHLGASSKTQQISQEWFFDRRRIF